MIVSKKINFGKNQLYSFNGKIQAMKEMQMMVPDAKGTKKSPQ